MSKDGRIGFKAELGGVTFGPNRAGMSFTAPIEDAEQRNQLLDALVKSRSLATIKVVTEEGELLDVAPHPVNDIVDVHRVSVGDADITGRLSFHRGDDNDTDPDDLIAIANRTVKVTLERRGRAGEEPAGAAEAGGEIDEEDTPTFEDAEEAAGAEA